MSRVFYKIAGADETAPMHNINNAGGRHGHVCHGRHDHACCGYHGHLAYHHGGHNCMVGKAGRCELSDHP